jgi:hypothetical protein
MRYLTISIALAALLGLSACAIGNVSQQAQLASACQGYASTLATLALNKDSLSESEVETVNDVRSVVNPICTDLENVGSTSDALTTVRNATRNLRSME